MVSGKHNCGLEFGDEARKDRNPHRSYASGRLTTERLVHQEDVGVRVAGHRLDVVAIEMASSVAGERLALPKPCWGVVARKANHADTGSGHVSMCSRPQVRTGQAWCGNVAAYGAYPAGTPRTAKEFPVLVIAVHPDERKRKIVDDGRIAVDVGLATRFPGSQVADLQDRRGLGHGAPRREDRVVQTMHITDCQDDNTVDRKSTRLNSSHTDISRMPSSA